MQALATIQTGTALQLTDDDWYFSNVRALDVQFPISQKRLRTIRGDAKERGRGQVNGLTWTDEVLQVVYFSDTFVGVAHQVVCPQDFRLIATSLKKSSKRKSAQNL